MAETRIICSQCGALDSFEGLHRDEMSNDEQEGGVFVCRECGHESGIWINSREET